MSDGVSLTLNCRKAPEKAERQGIPAHMAWDRRACEMSVTRKIMRGEGGLEVVDDRTDMRGGGCKNSIARCCRCTGTRREAGDHDREGRRRLRMSQLRLPPECEGWATLRGKIAERLDRYVAEELVSAEEAAPVRALLASDGPETIAAIAGLKTPVLNWTAKDFDHRDQFKTLPLRLGQLLLVGQG